MRKLLLVFFSMMLATAGVAQSDKEIAKVYIKRANQAIEQSIDFEAALKHFEKAMERLDTITDRKVASLGSSIYFEVHHKQEKIEDKLAYLKKSESYSKQYFVLAKNKSSEEYTNNLDNFVLIQETIVSLENEIKRLEEERIAREKELKRIDSLKTVWKDRSNELSIKADSIYKFNKNNLALFTRNGKYGVVNDVGNELVVPNNYNYGISYDGYIILMDKEENPTKLYSYNTNTSQGFELPPISDLNSLSTNYGKVMMPRANGRIVMYPNNSTTALVYDLEAKKSVKIANLKDLLKNLRKADKIDKYDDDDEKVKLNKNWYRFGGHLGGGIHPLFTEEGYNVYGFLFSVDGRVITNSDYSYLGNFYNNKVQAVKGNSIVWLNQNGTKTDAPKNEDGVYTGSSILTRLENGNYQIKQNGVIILQDKKLEKMVDYLRKNNAKTE